MALFNILKYCIHKNIKFERHQISKISTAAVLYIVFAKTPLYFEIEYDKELSIVLVLRSRVKLPSLQQSFKTLY